MTDPGFGKQQVWLKENYGWTKELLALLDSDRDGVLGSAEINGAPAALKAPDKNSDGQVTAEEVRPLPGCGRGYR